MTDRKLTLKRKRPPELLQMAVIYVGDDPSTALRAGSTLPCTFAHSTIGPAWLDFRVRDGNGYFPRGKITGNRQAPGLKPLSPFVACSARLKPCPFKAGEPPIGTTEVVP